MDSFKSVELSRIIDSNRVDFTANLSESAVLALADDATVKVLQCSEPIPDSLWRLLNAQFCSKRPDVQVRVYGHYSSECDLRFAQLLSNVQHFAADCLTRTRNVEYLAAMPNLKTLSVGIFERSDLNFLDGISPNLTGLSLGATRSKRCSLLPLQRFPQLRTLSIEGHSKEIEILSLLRDLEDLTLRSISTQNLKFLSPLTKLWSLDIKLGGINSFEGIEKMESLKYLELWQIQGLKQIGILSELPGLQDVFLQALPHITTLPPLDDAKRLRRLVVQTMKGLADFSALEKAPILEDFALIDGRRNHPAQLLPVLRNPSVRRVSAWLGTQQKNRDFSLLREEHSKIPMEPWEPFQYR